MTENIEHRRAAMEYLHGALGAAAPSEVRASAEFLGSPLEGEGDTSVFSYRAAIGGTESADYWVVAGATTANHYPHWGLTAEEVYDLHLGTRFMLVMEVSIVPNEKLPADPADGVRAFLATVAPNASVDAIEPAAAFNVDGDIHAVCRARVGGEDVYVLGLDAPPGVYRDVQLPPHVIFRMHIGQLIRREAAEDSP